MLTKPMKRWTSLLTVALIGTSVLAGCSQDSASQPADETAAGETCAPELTALDFGIISTESQANLKPLWEPFLEAMAAELGRPVNGFYATDYAGVIEAMGAGKLQLAWYGGKSYIEAAERSNAEAFAQTVAEDGSKGYYAHLISNKENPIVQEIDLAQGNGDEYVVENSQDLTFAFNDPNSTSGFLVPTYYVFAQKGVNPNTAFKQLLFAGSHEATAQAVANNQVDVATNNNESMARLQESDPAAFERVQIIWTSPEIPSDPIAYRKDLPDCMKEQLQDFFYTYQDEAVLAPLQWDGFVPADDATWNTIRELEIAKDILEVQNDANLNAEAKQQKLDELNQKLEALK
ncbi:MAG: phosphonate ABC transporter substrate-binding protein [Cyanobacteria bacterium Co-bin13]|nr:phosphonate ABC transporter substrate-binding protein [Cyanobacteria bacterium Co-bin13]